MSSQVAVLKRAAVLASFVVSSYAVFGHDAWAPEPARLDAGLWGLAGTTTPATYVNSYEPTAVVKWPSTWTAGSVASGTPCSTYDLIAGQETLRVIERYGPYARCPTWVTEGVRLAAALSGNGSTADALTLSTGEATTVVQFPATWTPNTTLAADTYCSSWPAPAGTAVGTVIVRSGNYAKCSY